MAVDKKRVIARLKALFPKANLSQSRLDEYSDRLCQKPADDADDAAIDAIIQDANSLIDFEFVAKEDDRVRTQLAKLQDPNPQPPAPAPAPAPNPPAPAPQPDDTPEWAKKLINKVDLLEKGKSEDALRNSAREAFAKSSKLNALSEDAKKFWLERIDINSQTSFDDQVKNLENVFDLTIQGFADSSSYHGPAGGGSGTTQVDDQVVSDVVSNVIGI